MFFLLPTFKPPVAVDINDATDSSRINPDGDVGVEGMEARIGATKGDLGENDSVKLPGETEAKDAVGSGLEGTNGGVGDGSTPLPTTTPVKSNKTTNKTTSSSSTKPTTKTNATTTTKTPAGSSSSSSKPGGGGGGGTNKPVPPPPSGGRDRSPPSVRPVQGKGKDTNNTVNSIYQY